jgi:hypothetical protein
MTGSAPLDDLPKMYDALISYAQPFEFLFGDWLDEAQEATEASDVVGFKSSRAELINLIGQLMADAVEYMYDHDARRTPALTLVGMLEMTTPATPVALLSSLFT